MPSVVASTQPRALLDGDRKAPVLERAVHFDAAGQPRRCGREIACREALGSRRVAPRVSPRLTEWAQPTRLETRTKDEGV